MLRHVPKGGQAGLLPHRDHHGDALLPEGLNARLIKREVPVVHRPQGDVAAPLPRPLPRSDLFRNGWTDKGVL